ncbi:DoxX family protein [Marinilongibacter aquaticus]|uniref:BT_3928 family protein n=1 Tax=Marinilongibacter aquaticus TaxID=2975157 RepID=UPI0021BD7DE7|nr:BT_3928 family protein [Marinilongibacter aquaticus]UBM58423.1 DoxX family protein [Marinilongibacter aquaticus]
MRALAQIARILVGIEFVFSGFVKVVDPYGTGLKLKEYFEVFALDLPAFSGFFEMLAHQSQLLSLLFCASEMILGVALLCSFKMPKTAWVVLLLMGFFTFLTFYSAYFNKVTDCGCFGDFLKLKPWHSFYKDIISLAVILIIFVFRKEYKQWKWALPLTVLGTIVAFSIGLYAKKYLPIIDFLPYAEGKSLPEQMAPTGVKPIIAYTFLEKESGKEIESQEFLMDTLQYEYLASRVLNEEEITPKITDFTVTDSEGNEFTEETLQGKKAVFIIKKIDKIEPEEIEAIKEFESAMQKNNIEVEFLTSVFLDEFSQFHKANNLSGKFFNTDEKVLKAMARTNSVLYVLDNGVVKGKWSSYNIPTPDKVLKVFND